MAALPYLDIGLEELNASASFSTDKFVPFPFLSTFIFMLFANLSKDKEVHQQCQDPATSTAL
jgi:hypothetical protein